MITPRDFVDALKKNGLANFTGVPCSFFQAAINRVIADPTLRYTIVPNEGAALALAAGASMAGAPTALLIQNSGFGNLVNPLTSLNMIYGLPVLIFVSGRAYGVPDEPQHAVIGKTLGATLDALGVSHEDMPSDPDTFREALAGAYARMRREKKPFVFFVRKGTLSEEGPARKPKSRYPLKRVEAIRIVSECLKGDEIVIATTGKPSRELFSVCDRRLNFYMQGSMGHAAAIGLGVAMHTGTRKKTVVLDGDGALLMHMGILSSIGHYGPKNLVHVVLDNESYETTGDQDTTSPTTDLAGIASACGYRSALTVSTARGISRAMNRLLSEKGPSFLRVKINRLPTESIPRISSKYDSETIARNFSAALLSDKNTR